MANLSRRQFLRAVSAAAAGLAVARCSGDGGDNRPSPSATPTAQPGTSTAAPTAIPSPTASATAEGPSIDEMAGQLLILGFRGVSIEGGNPIAGDLRDRHVGGVILFSSDVPSGGERNVRSPEQVRELCGELQSLAGTRRLLIGVDEEGGQVARLGPAHGFPATKSAAELGRGDPAATLEASRQIATTLQGVGVNLNFAPVVDVNTNPTNPVIGALDRSFSSDPDVVAAHAAAFARGHRELGVLTALKHFPGHGSSTGDSHAGFVDVSGTWQELELEPYRQLFAQDLADLVMVAHMFNAALDGQYPASLSSQTINGLLRGQLGFEGVVVSDDMGMGAITQQYGREEAIRLALNAGNDLLVFGNNLDTFEPELGARVTGTIASLVRKGDVAEERLRGAYERVTALRARLA